MKRKDIPSLDDLRAFEAVARLGSVRAAADNLALTHSAVSRRVTKLSADIDIKLFDKVGRGIRMTAEGESIYGVVHSFFEELQETIEEIRANDVLPPILLSCERSVAMQWLIPNFSEFQDLHPDIQVNLSVGGGVFDFIRDGITLAIRRIDFNVDPNWVIEKLFDEEVGPLLIPSLKDKFESGDYVALCSKTRESAWRDYLESNPDIPRPREFMFLDHHFLLVEAATSGLGVAMCPKVLAMKEMKSNRVIAPNGFQRDGSIYGLVYESKQKNSDHITILKNWIKKVAEQLNDS